MGSFHPRPFISRLRLQRRVSRKRFLALHRILYSQFHCLPRQGTTRAITAPRRALHLDLRCPTHLPHWPSFQVHHFAGSVVGSARSRDHHMWTRTYSSCRIEDNLNSLVLYPNAHPLLTAMTHRPPPLTP